MSKKMLFIIVGLVIFIVVILSVIYFSNNNENISNVDFKDNTTNEVALTNTIDNTNTMEIEKQENQVLNVIQEETQESKENTEDKISKETNDNQNVNTKDITSKVILIIKIQKKQIKITKEVVPVKVQQQKQIIILYLHQPHQ